MSSASPGTASVAHRSGAGAVPAPSLSLRACPSRLPFRRAFVSVAPAEEMRAFVERFPEHRERSALVAKHVALTGELGRLVDAQGSMEVALAEGENGLEACIQAPPFAVIELKEADHRGQSTRH